MAPAVAMQWRVLPIHVIAWTAVPAFEWGCADQTLLDCHLLPQRVRHLSKSSAQDPVRTENRLLAVHLTSLLCRRRQSSPWQSSFRQRISLQLRPQKLPPSMMSASRSMETRSSSTNSRTRSTC